MSVKFLPLLADMRNHPVPEFSMLPRARGKQWKANRPLMANVRDALPLSYARNGLAIIAKAVLCPGSKVLLPAYHCPALVEPFVWAQCNVDFYSLNADLSPDITGLTSKLAIADAVVLVPFFGFEQDVAKYADLARSYNCLPIEDLAHAAHATTLHGEYGVTSLQKFYPIATGGELLIANSVPHEKVQQCWRAYHVPQWRWIVSEFSRKIGARLHGEALSLHASQGGFRYFDPGQVGEPMLSRDIKQITRQDHAEIAATRRHNYQLLDKFFQHSRLGRSLYPGLGANDVPYVYPFLLAKAEYFNLIRDMAIPLYRWEEICPSGCETSNIYRSRLVQFPCHQDLGDHDIERLIAKLASAEDDLS